VRQVTGETANLVILTPPGVDPHTFEPRPRDIAAISEADLAFINGLGLEEALQPILAANLTGQLVDLSDGIEALPMDRESALHEAEDHDGGTNDPHVWMDPNNIVIWVNEIAGALAAADPANAAQYQANAAGYSTELQELDDWIRDQVALIPNERRSLVSDHAVFNYFARAYGFEQVGMIVPALSTNAAPSAQELADLEDAIRDRDIRAIFISVSINPATAQQVAADTGTQIVFVYTGALSEPGSDADSYLKFMRYNVTAFVNALK